MSHEQPGPSKKEEHVSTSTNKETGFSVSETDVQSMEIGLLKLLEEFNNGKLLSFGPNCSYEKLDAIREKQEELMRLHFEQDRKIQAAINSNSGRGRRPVGSLLSEEEWKTTKANVDGLITRLDDLSVAINDLHNSDHPD